MHRVLIVAGTLVLAAMLVGPVACRQIVGIGSSAESDLTTTVCGLPYGTNACAACVSTNCCAESNACAADPSCAPYESCVGGCKGDPRCRSQCAISNPTGTASDVSTLSGCLAKDCEAACGMTCGSIGDLVSPPDAAASCVSCLQTNVCAPARACASSADCDARVRCWQACRTQECEDACIGSAVYKEAFFEAGSGTSGFVSIGNLIATPDPIAGTCATQCAAGGDWGCVGQVSWALPARTTDSINLKLTDLVTSMSVPNVDVQLCAAIDANCTSPIAHGTTDPQGFVALPVQNVSQRTLGLNGVVQMESSNLETTLLYWGFPLGADAVGYWTDALVTTPMEFQAALASVNVTPLPLRGTLAAVAWDCLEYVAPGVRITLNTADGQTQSKDETGADATVTGPLGVLYFYNVPTGPVNVTATPMALGRASSQVSATVRAGAVTTVFLAPTPNP